MDNTDSELEEEGKLYFIINLLKMLFSVMIYLFYNTLRFYVDKN